MRRRGFLAAVLAVCGLGVTRKKAEAVVPKPVSAKVVTFGGWVSVVRSGGEFRVFHAPNLKALEGCDHATICVHEKGGVIGAFEYERGVDWSTGAITTERHNIRSAKKDTFYFCVNFEQGEPAGHTEVFPDSNGDYWV